MKRYVFTIMSFCFSIAEANNFAAGALSLVSVALRFLGDRGLVTVAGDTVDDEVDIFII